MSAAAFSYLRRHCPERMRQCLASTSRLTFRAKAASRSRIADAMDLIRTPADGVSGQSST